MQAVDPEREADGRQRTPETAEQLVIASTAADRRAERWVVDLEYGARVVADAAHQTKVEDHSLGDVRLEQLVQLRACSRPRPRRHPRRPRASSGPPRRWGTRTAAPDRPRPGPAAELLLQPDEVAVGKRFEQIAAVPARALPRLPSAKGTAKRRRGRCGSPRDPPCQAQRTTRRAPRRCPVGRMRRSARSRPAAARAAVHAAGARRDSSAPGSKNAAVDLRWDSAWRPRARSARSCPSAARAPHRTRQRRDKPAWLRPCRRARAPTRTRGRRIHLAVAVTLEHAAQGVGDGAHLARLVRSTSRVPLGIGSIIGRGAFKRTAAM